MIRITGGKFKRKKLASIDNFVRPTSSFKREAFFSIIESYGIKNSINLYENSVFLDLFDTHHYQQLLIYLYEDY